MPKNGSEKLNNMSTLEGKVMLITGASRGIGRALAIHLAAQGVRLALLARSTGGLAQVQEQIIQEGGHCLIFSGDVSDSKLVSRVAETVFREWGKIDILVNNAGLGLFRHSDAITPDEWDQIFATNVKGTFLMCNAVIPFMREQKEGHIINIASDVAKRVFAGGSLYCASKFAQDAYSMAIRKELRPAGIKVSVVYSGLVDSDFHTDPQGHESHQWWLKNEDMARAISFIASQPPHVVIDELMIHPLQQEY